MERPFPPLSLLSTHPLHNSPQVFGILLLRYIPSDILKRMNFDFSLGSWLLKVVEGNLWIYGVAIKNPHKALFVFFVLKDDPFGQRWIPSESSVLESQSRLFLHLQESLNELLARWVNPQRLLVTFTAQFIGHKLGGSSRLLEFLCREHGDFSEQNRDKLCQR